MKLNPVFQFIMRLVIWIVALALFAVGVVTGYNYVQDKSASKEQITARIVAESQDDDSFYLSYRFEGKDYKEQPVGKLLDNYGEIGDELKVFVNTESPRRVFLTEEPRGELLHASIFLGWSLVLFSLVWAERKLYQMLNIMTEEKE